MEFKDIEIIKTTKNYEEVVGKIEKTKKLIRKIQAIMLVIMVVSGFLIARTIFESKIKFIFLLLICIAMCIIWLAEAMDARIEPNIKYSHIFEASSVIAACIVKSNIEIVTENELHEVERHTLDFCKVVERTDISRAVLNLEEQVFYIPYKGE